MTDDLLLEFVAEATDHLTRAEEILLGFSRQPEQADAEAINACFRSVHTIKGCSGFLDLPRIQRLSHASEQVLDALRTHAISGSAVVFDVLLLAVSRLQAHVAKVSGQEAEIPETDDDCFKQLEALRLATPAQAKVVVSDTAAAPADVKTPPPMAATATVVTDPLDAIATAISEVIVAGPDDTAGITATIERLSTAMLSGPWKPEARAVMTHMRQLVGRLVPANAQDHFLSILKYCEDLELLHRSVPHAIETVAAAPDSSVPLPQSASAPTGDVLDEFISEAHELLSQSEVTVLGRAGFTPDEVNGVFRAIHTIKGMASYLAQPEIERAAHGIEAKIQAVRDGAAPADSDFSAFVLGGIDTLRALVGAVKRRQAVKDAHGSATPSPAPAPAGLSARNTAVMAPVSRLGDVLADLGVSRTAIEQSAATLKPGERIGDKLVADGGATRNQVEKAAQIQQTIKTSGDAFSRVATSKLEELMNQVGELLIAQAMVQHNPELPPNSNLAQAVGRQGRILRNLQVLSLSLRMVPLRGTFQKMSRVVYDTAKKIGKQVEFTLGGEDTEIDRTLAETMSDPLMHMVRNGVDHGIETPEVRIAKGKPAAGKLRLEAFQAGDDVVIRLIDDGAGMDAQRLRAKAIEKGLIDANIPMDEQACYQIIFLPGFSTAAKVTDVSGRGVGMDVVRRQVEAAKGVIHIASELGKGTTFTIRLPMTTAILDAMQLKVGGENLLLPISSIVEIMRPKPGQVQTMMQHARIIQHRERMLPMVHLGEALGISGGISDPEHAILVVIDNRGADFVMQVDAILGQRQVVIKPFDEGIAHHPGTSGTTILGDGHVALILNPACLVQPQAEAAVSR